MSGSWIPIGPAGARNGQAFTSPVCGGRVPGIAIARGGRRLYIATCNGGVWRSDDGGRSWRPTMDDQGVFRAAPGTAMALADSLACGAIACDPDQPELVVVGTGEADNGTGEFVGDSYLGVGMFSSNDGGDHWQAEISNPDLTGFSCYGMAMDPADRSRFVVATTRGLYRREADGLGGYTWQRKAAGVAVGADYAAMSVVAVRNLAGTVFYAAVRRRQAMAAGIGSSVVRSTDGGATWAPVAGTGLGTTAFERIALGVKWDDPTVVYAFIYVKKDTARLLRLDTTAGAPAWRTVAFSGGITPSTIARDQGTYDLCIAVSPDDANLVYLGGSTHYLGSGPNQDWSGAVCRCTIAIAASGAVSARATDIASSTHADIHCLVFEPEDPHRLWVGCDGGIFSTDRAKADGEIFTARNTGLATLQLNPIAQHPTEEALVFAGTQDNGLVRYTGEETWRVVYRGDSGGAVIDWTPPPNPLPAAPHLSCRVMASYTSNSLFVSQTAGSDHSTIGVAGVTAVTNPNAWRDVSPALASGEIVLFYAPLVGAPYNPVNPAEAGRVAFGTDRIRLTDNFGGAWTTAGPAPLTVTPAPHNNNNPLWTGRQVRSIAFAGFRTIYAGLMNGEIHQLVQAAVAPFAWVRTRRDNAPVLPAGALPVDPVLCLASHPVNANQFWAGFGGTSANDRLWFFDGANWRSASGDIAPNVRRLLPIPVNAIAVAPPLNPADPLVLFVGADIGVWRSIDNGAHWDPWSEGMPEVGVTDLKVHGPARLLRAATFGRGLFERHLDVDEPLVALYVRDHQLDVGRRTAFTLPGIDILGNSVHVQAGTSPDIVVDSPDASLRHQFADDDCLDYVRFVDRLVDDSAALAIADVPLPTRVYVQVHNRGSRWANGVRVLLLRARHGAADAVPALPPGYARDLERDLDPVSDDWQVLGRASVDDVRAGHPQVVRFDVPSTAFGTISTIAGVAGTAAGTRFSLLALVFHGDDPFAGSDTDAVALGIAQRQAARKVITVAHFAPAGPPPAPALPNRWRPLGPLLLRQGQAATLPACGGRVSGIAVARDGRRIYVGTGNGGVWRSDDAGRSWRSLSDRFDRDPRAGTTPATVASPSDAIHAKSRFGTESLAIGAVAIDPDAPELVYAGSGEAANNLSGYFGIGAMVSRDAGETWTTEVSSPDLTGYAFYALAVDPSDRERVFAATTRGLYRREVVNGLRVWLRHDLPGAAGDRDVTGLALARSGGATLVVCALRGGGAFASTDQGGTWNPLGGGLHAVALGRISLAMKADNARIIYALHADGRVQRLDRSDAPPTWKAVDDSENRLGAALVGGQGDGNLAIAVSPSSVNRIVVGGHAARLFDAAHSREAWSAALLRCEIVVGATLNTASVALGASLHPGVQALAFTPVDGGALWAGGDGGIFVGQRPDGDDDIFTARNAGLAAQVVNAFAQHPREESFIVAATIGNGLAIGLGDGVWTASDPGDPAAAAWNGDLAGVAIDWASAATPATAYRLLACARGGRLARSTDGGRSWTAATQPALAGGETQLPLPILVGAPFSATPAQSTRVALGTHRVWISDDFGGAWIATTPAALSAAADNEVNCITFASFNRLFVGLMNGEVYRLDRNAAGNWTSTRLDTKTGLPQGANKIRQPVNDLAPDPGNANRCYLAFGGVGAHDRLWFYNGTSWSARGFTATNPLRRLLPVSANAIAIDPATPANVHVGTDVGLWRSTDSGATWQPWSEGLPETVITDLQVFAPLNLLRVGTFGRGVWERRLNPAVEGPVELVLRHHALDMGWERAFALPLPDPLGVQAVDVGQSPDIRVDSPDLDGHYQFADSDELGFADFDAIADDSGHVAVHAATIVNRVYVQVRNRGPLSADGVRVALLLAQRPAAGMPALPADFRLRLVTGTAIAGGGWTSLGMATVDGLRSEQARIVRFDLPSRLLPGPASLNAGNRDWVLLALVHHGDDPFQGGETDVSVLGANRRQAAFKAITAAAFAGRLPGAGAAALPAHLPLMLPLAVTAAAGDRLAGLAGDLERKRERGVVTDTDRRVATLASRAVSLLNAGDAVPGDASAPATARLSTMTVLGAAAWDLPDYVDWFSADAGWYGDLLRRGSPDPNLSLVQVDGTAFVMDLAERAMALAASDEKPKVAAFVLGMLAALAAEVGLRPVLRGLQAARSTRDSDHRTLGVDQLVAESWVSRTLFARIPEGDRWQSWFPERGQVPQAIFTAFAAALAARYGLPGSAALRFGDQTAVDPALFSAEDLGDAYDLMRGELGPGAGMGEWFLLLLPIVLMPSLSLIVTRELQDKDDKRNRLFNEVQQAGAAAGTWEDGGEQDWYDLIATSHSFSALPAFVYSMWLWTRFPRNDGYFTWSLVSGIARVVLAIAHFAGRRDAPAGVRWGVFLGPHAVMDLIWLINGIRLAANARPGSAHRHVIQMLPLISLVPVLLFGLISDKAKWKSTGAFWGFWGVFTGLCLIGGVFAAWRLAQQRSVMHFFRDRSDPPLPDLSGLDPRSLQKPPPVFARSFADSTLWTDGTAGLDHSRYPSGARVLLRLSYAGAQALEIRPRRDRIVFRLGGVEQAPIVIADGVTAADLATQLRAALADLSADPPAAGDPAYALPWPSLLADPGDAFATRADHDLHRDDWQAVGDAAHPYLLRHVPRSALASPVGVPGRGCRAEAPLRLLPEPGGDPADSQLGRAGDLAALLALGATPTLHGSPLSAPAASGPDLDIGPAYQVFRKWNFDEGRRNEWRMLFAGGAVSEKTPGNPIDPGMRQPPDPGAYHPPASAGEALANGMGWVPLLRSWARLAQDAEADSGAERRMPYQPTVRASGAPPAIPSNKRLSEAFRFLLDLP